MQNFNDFSTKHLTLAELIEIRAMSTICPQRDGYGVILVIMTNDHNPPHFHVFKSSANSKTLCRYIITDDEPESVQDLIPMKGDKDLPRKDKLRILEWATDLYEDSSFTNWKYAKNTWKKEALTDISIEGFPTIAEAKLGL